MGTSLSPIILKETAAPATPPAASVALYSLDGSALLMKDDAGVVTTLGGGVGIGALTALTGSNLAGGDKLVVADISVPETKSLTADELLVFLQTNGALPRKRRLTATKTSTQIAPTKATDLDLPLPVGTHVFQYYLIVRSATTTVAPQFNLNFGGTGAPVWWFQYADLSATLLAAIGQMANAVTTPTLGFQMATAVRTEGTTGAATMGPVNGVQATGQDILAKITGIVVVSATGNLELWHGSETATSTSLEVGSSLLAWQTG